MRRRFAATHRSSGSTGFSREGFEGIVMSIRRRRLLLLSSSALLALCFTGVASSQTPSAPAETPQTSPQTSETPAPQATPPASQLTPETPPAVPGAAPLPPVTVEARRRRPARQAAPAAAA